MLFTKPPQGSLILILDIQSSLVRASLVYVEENVLPRIVHTYHKNIGSRPGSGSSRIIHTTLEALKEIMGNVYHFINLEVHKDKFPKKIKEAHFVLSSPWVISQAKTLTQKFEQNVQVSEKLILDLISKERTNFLPESELENNHVDIIEQKIFNVRLNGYPVADWKDKKTKELEISFAVSVAGSNTEELFRDACTIVPRSHVHFHSSLLLQHIALRQIMPHQAAYTLVHVHGELTDVAVVNRHSCIFFGSYPVGAFTVVRRIARESNTDLEVADSAVKLCADNCFDTTHGTGKDISAVQAGGEYWGREMQKMFATVQPPVGLPAHTILCGHVHESFFVESLKAAYPGTQIEMLTIEQIKPFVRYEAHEEPARLSGLYTMALYSIMRGAVI
ncbi:MAG: hypothetical protein V4481_03575 [Patescibacteria group bacterium]